MEVPKVSHMLMFLTESRASIAVDLLVLSRESEQ